MKYIIVGGVAAGASAAARLRRLNENAEIILIEKNKDISYANCGLPYHLGGVIPERENLLVMSSKKFTTWFNVDVRTEHEVIDINRNANEITVKTNNNEYTEKYDKLLLATGATPIGEEFTDEENPHVMHLWTLSDMDRVLKKLNKAKKAVIIGAGFIGLEVAENLKELGLDVTIIQRSQHVLPTVDADMASFLTKELLSKKINIKFGCTLKKYHECENHVDIELENGEKISADVVIVSTGVVPNSTLAQKANLKCNERGHIIVDEHLRTSDNNIYAAGDVVEVSEPILGGKTAIPLAGPANKQGRIAANNMSGISVKYKGSYGASIVKVGSLTAASVGLTEKRLKALNVDYKKIYIHPASSATYYPGAIRMTLKLLFSKEGNIYGAQIVGNKGVDKRIDSIAQAMEHGLNAVELGELELAYAPPYSSAKDPVNFAGFVAENVLSGLSDVTYPDCIPSDANIIDVREVSEYELGAIPNATNIPLGKIRTELAKLDKSKNYVVYCQVGLRGYLAERILKQNGFKVMNLSGGYLTWKMFK